MDFGTMVDKIAQRCLRPDKAEDIKDAINDAIEYCVVNGDFADDLVEGNTTVDSTVYTQSIVISTTFTRFRKVKYLRPNGYNKLLSPRDPARIFDDKGNTCRDVWYRAGDNLILNTSSLVSTIYYGYYQFPARMEDDTDEHWMLSNMYTAIFNIALADIWDDIGRILYNLGGYWEDIL
jgi:hypothetical protein